MIIISCLKLIESSVEFCRCLKPNSRLVCFIDPFLTAHVLHCLHRFLADHLHKCLIVLLVAVYDLRFYRLCKAWLGCFN